MGNYIIGFLGDKLPFLIGIAILLLSSLIGFFVAEIREKIKSLFSCGRGKIAIGLTYTLIVGAIIYLLFVYSVELWVTILIFSLLVCLIAFIWYITLCNTPLVLIYIIKFKRQYKQGFIVEHQEAMLKKPWYAISIKDRYSCTLLQYGYFVSSSNYRKAYESLERVDVDKLFPWEKDRILSNRAFVLKCLGSNGAAEKLYPQIKNLRPTDQSVLAVIHEEAGEISKAQEILQDLNNSVVAGNIVKSERSIVANNLGRIYLMTGNFVAAADKYRIALNYAIKEEDTQGIEISRDNLIFALARTNKEEARRVFEEHIKWMESLPDTIWRKISLANTKLKFGEMFEDLDIVKSAVEEVKVAVKDFPLQSRIGTLISTAKIICRFRLSLDSVILQIAELYPDILKCSMPERFVYIRDLAEVLAQIQVYAPTLIELRAKVEDYLSTRAYDELTEYIRMLPPYMVYERTFFLKECTMFKSRRDQNFIEYKNSMMQIAEMYHLQGLNFNYLQTLMQIADEAYFYTPCICGEKEGLPVSKYENEAREIVKQAEEVVSKFYGYPQIAEIHLQFSFIYLCFGDCANAKRHLDHFDSLKLSLLSFHHDQQKRYEFMKEIIAKHLVQ